MALKDRIALGMSLPHRSPDPIRVAAVRDVATRAEALGFSDLWVTENTLDYVHSFDPVAVLTYAAALTQRIRLGVAVCVLPLHHPAHVAHQFASLDCLSNGRAILGVGLGRKPHYDEFEVPMEHRVTRFREGIEIVRALWTQPQVDYHGSVYRLHDASITMKPVQKPHPPLWLGGDHPNALRRAAALGDGWMGSGASSVASFGKSVAILRAELEKAGRDPADFPISKRVFMAIDERPGAARAEVDRWFTTVYHNPAGADQSGIHGSPEEVREKLEALVAAGANHLLLNPVSRYGDELDAAAQVAGLAG